MANPSSLDLDVTAALEASDDYRLLYAAGKICGFETTSRGWLLNLYVGTYDFGEFVEGCAQHGETIVRLTAEQAQLGRTKLPSAMPKPEAP